MSITITGKKLTIEDVVNVARHGAEVELHPDAVARIERCRGMLERKIEAREKVLNAAALTYVASALQGMLTLFYLLSRRRR